MSPTGLESLTERFWNAFVWQRWSEEITLKDNESPAGFSEKGMESVFLLLGRQIELYPSPLFWTICVRKSRILGSLRIDSCNGRLDASSFRNSRAQAAERRHLLARSSRMAGAEPKNSDDSH